VDVGGGRDSPLGVVDFDPDQLPLAVHDDTLAGDHESVRLYQRELLTQKVSVGGGGAVTVTVVVLVSLPYALEQMSLKVVSAGSGLVTKPPPHVGCAPDHNAFSGNADALQVIAPEPYAFQ
jgi:hypothetical protein